MKVKMLKTCLGSEDGINTSEYMEGEIYTVGEGLGVEFIQAKEAKIVSKKVTEKLHKRSNRGKKKLGDSPENKSL